MGKLIPSLVILFVLQFSSLMRCINCCKPGNTDSATVAIQYDKIFDIPEDNISTKERTLETICVSFPCWPTYNVPLCSRAVGDDKTVVTMGSCNDKVGNINIENIKKLQEISKFRQSKEFSLFYELLEDNMILQALSLLSSMSKSKNISNKYFAAFFINKYYNVIENMYTIRNRRTVYSKKEWSSWYGKYKYVKPANISYKFLSKFKYMVDLNVALNDEIVKHITHYRLKAMDMSIVTMMASIINKYIQAKRHIDAIIVLGSLKKNSVIEINQNYVKEKKDQIFDGIRDDIIAFNANSTVHSHAIRLNIPTIDQIEKLLSAELITKEEQSELCDIVSKLKSSEE